MNELDKLAQIKIQELELELQKRDEIIADLSSAVADRDLTILGQAVQIRMYHLDREYDEPDPLVPSFH